MTYKPYQLCHINRDYRMSNEFIGDSIIVSSILNRWEKHQLIDEILTNPLDRAHIRISENVSARVYDVLTGSLKENSIKSLGGEYDYRFGVGEIIIDKRKLHFHIALCVFKISHKVLYFVTFSH